MNPEELQQKILEVNARIDDLNARLVNILKKPPMPDHFHTGFDASRIYFTDIYQRKVWIHHTIYGADAATAGNYGVFFIVPFTCIVTQIREVHQTLGTDAGAVTLTIEKLTGTQALDAGVSTMSGSFNLKGTINTVLTATLTGTLADRNLAIGNRLAMDDAGTLAAVANVTVFVELQLT